jgi:Ca2+-binding RTX toxin-like protein
MFQWLDSRVRRERQLSILRRAALGVIARGALPMIERVERRLFLDSCSFNSPNSGDINYTGTSGNDSIVIEVRSVGGVNHVFIDRDNGAFTCDEPVASLGHITVNGSDGNDTIDASAAPIGVTIQGGNDNDTIIGSTGNDNLDGGSGSDWINFTDRASTAVTINLANGTAGASGESDTLSAFENATGGGGADTITGSTVANQLVGGGGNDTILGGDGNDTLTGSAGDDSMLGQNGNDLFLCESSSDGADSLFGGANIDTVDYSTRSNNLTITLGDATANDGESGEMDYVRSDTENVQGGGGHDYIAGSDNDSVNSANGANELRGGAGHDTLIGNGGNDTLYGDAGNDSVLGGAGNDSLHGWTGDDSMWGGSGNDTLEGESGNDSLYGETGADSMFGGSFTDGDDSFADFLDGGDDSDFHGTETLDTYQNFP